jgi:hypothetical protein
MNDNDDKYIYELLNKHIEYCNLIDDINKKIKNMKKIRHPNFPESISEYIVKKCYENKYKVDVNFGKIGDLVYKDTRIEVKAFTSSGPSSFGPDEKWNQLIFVDASLFREKKFKIYQIDLSNDDPNWKNIKVNSKDTYEDHCKQKRRPRILFSSIYKILNDFIKVLFDGIIKIDENKLNFS